MSVQIKRVYEKPASKDGYRVLVDRLWPRGLPKKDAAINEWLPEVAPSTALRRWFAHETSRWLEFKRRYFAELEEESVAEAVSRLRTRAARCRVTLLYAAKDELHNNAVALQEYLARPSLPTKKRS